MEITLPLLGVINRDAPSDHPLRTKYIVRATAAQLATYLQYERRGAKKAAPFKIKANSLIRIDPRVQRGTDAAGFLSQQPKKIAEIASVLLGHDEKIRRLYLGALVWNVRPPGSLLIEEVKKGDKPSEYRLCIDTDAIYLTDSAHRHFGIVEAYNAWSARPSEFERFKPQLEFAIEVYNLDSRGETELFNELNAKQKKIPAAKVKELDVTSPLGLLKDSILALDLENRKLLENNLEVTSNQNIRHSLLTMSVLVSSISEMFGTELTEAWDDEDLRDELATYYCDFLYALADKIVVRLSSDAGSELDIHPFRNLYQEIIKKAVEGWDESSPEESQKKIDLATEKAVTENRLLRRIDIATSNATVKALFRLGGLIRHMDGWSSIVSKLQTDLNVPMGGRFFQAANTDLFDKTGENDVPIASLNEDKSVNVQVQTKVITKLFGYLRRKLDLNVPPIVTARKDGVEALLIDDTPAQWTLVNGTDNFRTLDIRVVLPRKLELTTDNLTLKTVAIPDWKGAKQKLEPTRIARDESYVHPTHEDLCRWTASFELRLPSADKIPKNAELKLVLTYPDFDASELRTDRRMVLSKQ